MGEKTFNKSKKELDGRQPSSHTSSRRRSTSRLSSGSPTSSQHCRQSHRTREKVRSKHGKPECMHNKGKEKERIRSCTRRRTSSIPFQAAQALESFANVF